MDQPPTLSAPESLAIRAEKYGEEVERVVGTVGEHPLYELKKSCALSNLFQKIELVKDIQSIATSRIDFEKYIVIGADEKTKTFFPVSNAAEFDEATVRQLLDKYLHPTPSFQVFSLITSNGHPFVLLVIGKQKTRRILARTTVDDPADPKRKPFLREGDLWTKGESTGKRLARPEDWDEIYEEVIERESEARTRRRTDQVVQQVVAQERLRAASGHVAMLPAYLSDEEFIAFVEGICIEADERRLGMLLERLRDDLVEGWHSCRAYDDEPVYTDPQSIPSIQIASRKYRDDHFLPAMQRLTFLGVLIVKNSGSLRLFEETMNLLRETYSISHELHGLRLATPRGSSVKQIADHISHTTPALQTLLSVNIVGAYITKRRRFAYLRTLLKQPVHVAGHEDGLTNKRMFLAMWPLSTGWGEPDALRLYSGRIDLCKSKILNDPAFSKLFGSETNVLKALVQFDYLVEWNSYLALGRKTPSTVADYIKSHYPDVNFTFRASLVAFELKYLEPLVTELFSTIRAGSFELLSQTLIDPAVMPLLSGDALSVFLECLRGVEDEHERWMLQMHRMSFFSPWPKQLNDALEALPPRPK